LNHEGNTVFSPVFPALFIACATLALLASTALPAKAADSSGKPIGIAVIAPLEGIVGKSQVNGAEMAVHDINAAGGVNGRKLKLYKFDASHSATKTVRAWQKAVQQDHVVAGVGIYASEVGLALEPWAARYKRPFIDTASASPKISKNVHDNYKKFKYMFLDNLNSTQLAKLVCKALHDTVVKTDHASRAAIMSENYAWTEAVVPEYQKCLPKAGLKVTKTVKFGQDTKDFSPIFSKLLSGKPQIFVTALAHFGQRPTVQWAHGKIPALMAGVNARATSSAFWKKTNGATEGVISMNSGSVNGAPITPNTAAFDKAYKKRFKTTPAYAAYTTYDAVQMIAKAIEEKGSTKGSDIVSGLESLDYVGVGARYVFYGKNSPLAHGVKFGKDYDSGYASQWQSGDQIVIWPPKVAQGKVKLPSFVKPAFKKK
jgi:branched-chain amino acid transport system substrate-binding protein